VKLSILGVRSSILVVFEQTNKLGEPKPQDLLSRGGGGGGGFGGGFFFLGWGGGDEVN